MYGLFNTRALTVVSMIYKVTNPLLCYRIWHHSSFTIIQQLWSLTSRSDAIICRLDLTRINSLTHSHLQCSFYSIEDGSVSLGYSRNPRSVFVLPAYGYIELALVKCSNDGGPDTTWRGIQGLLFLACWWCTICIFWPLSEPGDWKD